MRIPPMLHALRILVLTPELPYPPWGGGTIKSATLLDYLSERHEVDVLCLRGIERLSASDPERFAAVRTGNMRTEDRSLVNVARSYSARIPLSIYRNRWVAFGSLVQEHVRERPPDAVFVDGWLMAQYLPSSPGATRALHQHNAEFVMWNREAAIEANPLRRWLIRREAERVRRYEASILGRFEVIFAVSEPDRDALSRLVAEPVRMELLPNVAQPGLIDRPELSPGSDPTILYLATLSWQPNVQGLLHFLDRIFPEVRGRLPGARLLVAGRGAPRELVRLANRTEGVELIGGFEDPEPLYRKARAFIEVARGGSGTRVKVLNALARSLPVVTTPEGAEGLAIRSGEHALVASSGADLAHGLIHVLTNDAIWATLSQGGRRLVRERYVPEVAFAVLDEVFA